MGTARLNAAAGEDKYHRTFSLLANTGGLTYIPGFPDPVVIDLASVRIDEGQIPLLRDHDFARPVGHTNDLALAAGGIEGVGETSYPGDERQEIIDAADSGFEWQLSVGGHSSEDDIVFIERGQSLQMNGRVLQGPFFFVMNFHLREVSFVALGADSDGARATLVAALTNKKDTGMTFAQWLAQRGKTVDQLSAEEFGQLKAQYETWKAQAGESTTEGGAGDSTLTGADGVDAGGTGQTPAGTEGPASTSQPAGETTAPAQPGPVASSPEADGVLERTAAEVELAASLQTINGQFGNPMIDDPNNQGRQIPLLAHALRERWSADRFELEALRRSRPQPLDRQAQQGGGGQQTLNAAFVGALMLRAGVDLDTNIGASEDGRRYLSASFRQDVNSPQRQRWMEQAHGFRNHSLIDLVIECGMANGLNLRNMGHYRGNAQWMRAAFSSMEIQDMFTQSMTAILLDSYMQQNNQLFPMVRRRDVPNFLPQERKRMLLNSNDFEQLLPTQTASDMVLSSTGEQYSIKRYAKMLTVNEETLIDERFDVIEDQPREMANAAARLDPELILALLLNNPNMADGNAFLSGAAGNLRTSSAFTRDNLKAALTQFKLQKEGGVTLNLQANGLFHPAGLEFDVAEVLAAARLITGSGSARTDVNVLSNIVNPVMDARLDNGFQDPADRQTAIAGEPTSWFLFNTQYPAIELGHLQGTGDGMTLDSGVLSQGQWGIWFSAKKDAGAAPMRRESIQKNEA